MSTNKRKSIYLMSEQPQLFETEDQYGNDIIQEPKLVKKKLTTKEQLIDPKNPHTVGTSVWNLGNHTCNLLYNVFSLCGICKLSIGDI